MKQSASHILEQSLQRSHARKKSLPGVSAHIFILMINSQECIVMLPWAKNLKIASSSDLLGWGGRLWRGDCWLEGPVAKGVTGTKTIFFVDPIFKTSDLSEQYSCFGCISKYCVFLYGWMSGVPSSWRVATDLTPQKSQQGTPAWDKVLIQKHQ